MQTIIIGDKTFLDEVFDSLLLQEKQKTDNQTFIGLTIEEIHWIKEKKNHQNIFSFLISYKKEPDDNSEHLLIASRIFLRRPLFQVKKTIPFLFGPIIGPILGEKFLKEEMGIVTNTLLYIGLNGVNTLFETPLNKNDKLLLISDTEESLTFITSKYPRPLHCDILFYDTNNRILSANKTKIDCDPYGVAVFDNFSQLIFSFLDQNEKLESFTIQKAIILPKFNLKDNDFFFSPHKGLAFICSTTEELFHNL